MPHELFVITRQKTKIRNTFAKSQLAKIIQSGGLFGTALRNLGKKYYKTLLFLWQAVLPKLATKATSYVLNKFERKISGQGAARAGKGLILFLSNEDMDDILKIVVTTKIRSKN